MASFTTLWQNHVGHDFVCDENVFSNQCAMRVGQALDDSSVTYSRTGLRTCVGYNRRRFADHAPGHVRSAQQLANLFERSPQLISSSTTFQRFSGTMNDNMDTLKSLRGMLFILNGWGRTDHIDFWNGSVLKGGFRSFFSRGSEVWFWSVP